MVEHDAISGMAVDRAAHWAKDHYRAALQSGDADAIAAAEAMLVGVLRVAAAEHAAAPMMSHSLRDWFAGMALASGQILLFDSVGGQLCEEGVATAYKVADVMLAEREKEAE